MRRAEGPAASISGGSEASSGQEASMATFLAEIEQIPAD
jgi:hypothetical protein